MRTLKHHTWQTMHKDTCTYKHVCTIILSLSFKCAILGRGGLLNKAMLWWYSFLLGMIYVYQTSYHFLLLRLKSRAESFLMNGGELTANFTPHPFVSYHMEEQDCNALECNTVRNLTYIICCSMWYGRCQTNNKTSLSYKAHERYLESVNLVKNVLQVFIVKILFLLSCK